MPSVPLHVGCFSFEILLYSRVINGDGNHTTQCSLLAGCLEHGAPHTKNPDGSATEGHFGSQGVKLTLLWRNVPHLDVTKAWAKWPIFDTTFGGKLQRRFTFFETIKSSLTFHFFCVWPVREFISRIPKYSYCILASTRTHLWLFDILKENPSC